jgi:transcriptional regulator with PAS, ATPase and Fis domain
VSHASLSQNRQQLERDVIQRVLATAGCTRTQAASALGISRVTLYKKVKKYGLTWTPLETAPNPTPAA